jgi:alkanesulfonate monooxygenase SsuD/methylene tetrahydromethanopterin reductase-like flavin-dependent oxidoreductase (luciferase family)
LKFNLFMLPSMPCTFEERSNLRPIGRNPGKYQEMLTEVRELAVLADELGFDALSTTEHHFHSEGFEVSVAPLLLYTDLAARTKRIKFASLALVLPTWDPIRVAEEIAILDHLTKGRFIAGFARGYQDRWTNVLGQHYHVMGTPMDGSSTDAHNREVFEEVFQIMKMCWRDETVRFKGKYYEIPTPFETGIQRWPVAKSWTEKYGAKDELDANGAVQRICVVPKPYTDPHPPIWQPFSVSEKTIRWCATESIVPFILVSHPSSFRDLCAAYRDEGEKAGRTLGLGESVGAFRSIHIGDTYGDAYRLGAEAQGRGFIEYFSGFGFFEAFRLPGETTPVPQSFERLVEAKYELVGTVDDVKRELDALRTNGNPEWFAWYFDQGIMPLDEAKRQLELFATKVMPEFRDD